MYLLCPASQMKTLVRLFPFIVGEYVPESDEHWSLLLTLWDICTMVTSFTVTEEDATDIAWKIEVLLETYCELYPNSSFVPKMHYLVHLPDEILRSVYNWHAFLLRSCTCTCTSFVSLFTNADLVHHETLGVCDLNLRIKRSKISDPAVSKMFHTVLVSDISKCLVTF